MPPPSIRLFVKPEWHKRKKLDDKRYRLIWQVSVVDQIIDHLLVDEYFSKEVENWVHLPTKVGMSYANGGWKTVPRGWGYDRQAWDMTVPRWLLDLYERFLHEQISADRSWHFWLKRRFSELYDNPEVQLSNGVTFRQVTPGIQKSGSLYTLNGNSTMQILLHYIASKEAGVEPTSIIAMGDDTVQPRASQGYLNAINEYVTIKGEEPNEFCGMHYGMTIEPVYTPKHLLSLAADPTYERLVSYQFLYGKSKLLGNLQAFNKYLGYPKLPDHTIKSVWG